MSTPLKRVNSERTIVTLIQYIGAYSVLFARLSLDNILASSRGDVDRHYQQLIESDLVKNTILFLERNKARP